MAGPETAIWLVQILSVGIIVFVLAGTVTALQMEKSKIGADFICWHYCFCFSRYSNCSSNGGVQDWCRFYLLAWSVFALDFKCVSVSQWRATSKTPDLSNSYSFFNSNLFLIPIKFLILNHFQFWFIFNSDLFLILVYFQFWIIFKSEISLFVNSF